jgi:hypothetical protein
MEIIKKNIDLKKITGNSISIPIFLYQKTDNIGLYEDLSEDLTLTPDINITVTGITESKLNSVRGYDYDNLYQKGVNGVEEVTSDYVRYNINGIVYKTNLNDDSTTFTFSTVNNGYMNNNFISVDNNIGYVDKVNIQDSVYIERENISVIESFSKIRQIGLVSEIATFANGFFTVKDQTI